MRIKINKFYKTALTVHNTAARLEKGLIVTAFSITTLKLLSSFIMDRTKTIK